MLIDSDEAIKRVGRYWYTGMDDYFTYDEILELGNAGRVERA